MIDLVKNFNRTITMNGVDVSTLQLNVFLQKVGPRDFDRKYLIPIFHERGNVWPLVDRWIFGYLQTTNRCRWKRQVIGSSKKHWRQIAIKLKSSFDNASRKAMQLMHFLCWIYALISALYVEIWKWNTTRLRDWLYNQCL